MNIKSLSNQPINRDHCVTVDSNLQTFELQIHSLSPVDREVLKNLIQRGFKVISLEKTDHTLLVK